MSRYELYDHRRKTEFRSLGGHIANLSSSVIRISEEIFSQQAVCMSILPGPYKWNCLTGKARAVPASQRERPARCETACRYDPV